MNTPGRLQWLGLLVTMLMCTAFGAAEEKPEKPAAARPNVALLLTIRDAIGPATSSFFLRTLEDARERNARLLILEMDTPGGLDSAMREMIQAILASPRARGDLCFAAPAHVRRAPAPTCCTPVTLRRWRRRPISARRRRCRSARLRRPPSLHQTIRRQGRRDRQGRTRHGHGAQGRQRFHRLYPRARRAARSQRRVGGIRGAQRHEPDRNGSSRAEGHRHRRDRPGGSAEADGRSRREDGRGRSDARDGRIS